MPPSTARPTPTLPPPAAPKRRPELPPAVVVRLWNIATQTVWRWSANDGNVLAASMAYYAAFSFFPLMLVLLSVFGFALKFSTSAQSAQAQLVEFVSQSTNPALGKEVERFAATVLNQVENRASSSGLIGWLLLLFGAIGIFSQLEAAFDRLWHAVTPHEPGLRAAVRNALWNRLKAFLTLVGLGVLALVALATNLTLTAIRTWAEQTSFANDLLDSGTLWHSTQWAISVGLNAMVLTLVYKMIPRAKVRFVHAAMGGVVVAFSWQLGSQVLARFIVGGNYSAYGVVGSFIAVMLWVYYASILLLLGAQLVQVLGHPENQLPPPPPGGVA
jgi:membrane protein